MSEVLAQARSERSLADWSDSKFSDIISFLLVHRLTAQLEKMKKGTKQNYTPSNCLYTLRVFTESQN